MPDEPVFQFDFTDAPPAQGSTFDRIPPGTYVLRLEKAERVESSKGSTMARVTCRVDSGQYAGKRLGEQFVFPKDSSSSKFGLQRFHAFLIALGMKQATKKVEIDLRKFVGRTCVAEVDDEEIPAVTAEDGTEKYPMRIRSRPLAFYRQGDPDAPPVTGGVAPAEADEAAPEPAPAPAPKAAKKAAVAVAEPEEPAEQGSLDDAVAAGDPEPEDVTTDLDDLFE